MSAYSKTFQKGKLELPTSQKIKSNDKDVYDLMDLADEQQIRLEFMGRFVDEYVYSFPVETKEGRITVSGLSYAGTKEMVKGINLKGKARYTATDIPPVVEEHDTYWLAKVQCEDKKTGLKIWGVKKQNKRKAGGQVDDHAEVIAVSKAQRNGLQGLIPKGLVNEFIKEYLKKKGAVKPIIPTVEPKVVITPKPQPVDDRDIFFKGVNIMAGRLAMKIQQKKETIIAQEVNNIFGDKVLEDLSLEQLKTLHRDLTSKYEKTLKPAKEVAPVQQKIGEFYNDTGNHK